VVERADPVCTRADGTSPPAGPAPVGAADGSDGRPGDVTPLGIVNLIGGVAEWARDSAHPYDEACWLDAPVLDPVCEEANAPFRAVRGSSWAGAATPGFVRYLVPQAQAGVDPTGLDHPHPELGFRCVYGAAK
jgi:formylglycine-generating enzyme required for sulfatase activity